MKVVLLAEAQRRFEAEDEWWRANRDAKELFTDEFEQTLERLAAYPELGQTYRATRGQVIQRVLMTKTRCHVYYFHDRENAALPGRSQRAHGDGSRAGLGAAGHRAQPRRGDACDP